MYQVVKRDGKTADFNISKINAAIVKAFRAQEKEYNEDLIINKKDMQAFRLTLIGDIKVK